MKRLRSFTPISQINKRVSTGGLAGVSAVLPFLELGYTYGWRRAELLSLRVRQVNFVNRTIRLDTIQPRIRRGREVAMTPRVCELLQFACDDKEQEDHVLTRQDDEPVRDFRGAWYNLCLRAGFAKLVCRKRRSSEARTQRRVSVPPVQDGAPRRFPLRGTHSARSTP